MRIGIDCRICGSSHGHMGKYIENFVSYLEQNNDGDEYVLFFNEREFGDFTPISSRFHALKTRANIGGIAEQIIFPWELYKEKLDIMLFSNPLSPLLYVGKTIIILSDLIPYFYPEKRLKGDWMRYWHRYILRRSIRKSSTIIAFSEVLGRDIIEIFDTHEEKIQVIPPMSPKTGMKPSENETKKFFLQEGINEKYMLSEGDLREYKNIPRLLQAYNLLMKEDGIIMDLVLIGKEDPTHHEIRSTIIQLGLQSRVHIYNVLEEDKVVLLYQNASLYILPSLYEGSELPILAPLMYGLPIATSSLPSITAVLGKEDAVFFRPMSIPDMKEALKKALKNPRELNKRDMSEFSILRVSEKILSVFTLYKRNKGPE